MNKTLMVLAGVIASVSAFAQWSDPFEGLDPNKPITDPANGFGIQSGAAGAFTTITTSPVSPRYSSTQALKQYGDGATPTRVWKNIGKTINSGVYIYEYDVYLTGGVNPATGTSQFFRTRLEKANNNFNEQVTTTGIIRTDTGEYFAGNIEYVSGGLTIHYFLAPMAPNQWWRQQYIVDFDNKTITGPIVIDITDPNVNMYYLIGNLTYGFNTDIVNGGYYSTFECITYGAGAGVPNNEGWILDNVNMRGAARVTGKVELQDFAGDPTAVDVLLYAGDYLTYVTPDANGNYSAVVPQGTYTIGLKASHWLKKNTSAAVTVGAGGATVETLSLINGDVDDDNVVTVFDYNALSDAFDSADGDANWNANADLDGDGSVTVYDYNILSQNFDLAGDA